MATIFTDTTAADLYRTLSATVDNSLIEDFCICFESYWGDTAIGDVAAETASYIVNDMAEDTITRALLDGIEDNDSAALDAFTTTDSSYFKTASAYWSAVAAYYTYEKTAETLSDNLATYALIAAANWVSDERGADYPLYGDSIKAAAEMAARGDATPKAIAYTLAD